MEEKPFKDISYLELWQPFCSAEQTICAILVEGAMRNNSVYNLNLGQWFRRRCRLNNFLSGALADLLFSGAEPFMQF